MLHFSVVNATTKEIRHRWISDIPVSKWRILNLSFFFHSVYSFWLASVVRPHEVEHFDTFNVIRKITRTQCKLQRVAGRTAGAATEWFRCTKCVCHLHCNFAFSILIRTHGDRIAGALLSFLPGISQH